MCVDKKDLKCKYEGCENPVKYSSLLICNAHYQWEKKGKPEPGYKVINCEVCKKEIKPKAGNQKFCKECQYQRRLQQHYDRHRVDKVSKICEWCKKEFITNRSFQKFCTKDCFNKYDLDHKSDYYLNVTKIRDNHLDRRESYPQKYVFDIIREEFSSLEWKYDVRSIIRNPITKHMLELDIWCEEKKVAIEFDGEQHSAPKYGERVFEITKRNDKIKEEMCVEKNIKLLRISYKDDWKNKEWVIGKVGELINDNY
jgi:very-short-patch-repair endonuclease